MVSSEPRSERPRGSHFCPNSTVSGSERTVSREMQAFKEVVRFETDAGAKAEAMLSAERRRAAVFMLFLLICERLVVTAYPFLAQRTSSWIFEGRVELFVDSQVQSCPEVPAWSAQPNFRTKSWQQHTEEEEPVSIFERTGGQIIDAGYLEPCCYLRRSGPRKSYKHESFKELHQPYLCHHGSYRVGVATSTCHILSTTTKPGQILQFH